MLYQKSQTLKIWVALAVGSLAIGQLTPAVANPKPMQSETNTQQPIRSTTPSRTNELNRNNQTNPNTPPPGANPDTRPTQSDGTNQTSPTERMLRNEIPTDGNAPKPNLNQNTPPAGANPDTRPTQSDGTDRVNPTDRRLQNNQMDRTKQVSDRFEGKVEQYLLNREGVVDGFLLSNGIQVKFPPHQSSSLVDKVKVGDTISVMGKAGTSSPMGQEVLAYSLTNGQSEFNVTGQPPTTPPTTSRMNYSTMSVEGTAKQWLVGQRGEINGLILSDGTQVRFSPQVGNQLMSMAKVGAKVEAQGMGMKNSYGQVVEATLLTVDGQMIASGKPSMTMPSSMPSVPMK